MKYPSPMIDPASHAYAARQGRLCAQMRWTGLQMALGLLACVVIGIGLAMAPVIAWLGLSAVIALLAVSTVGVRLLAMALAIWRDPTIQIGEGDVQSVDGALLPRYCVLVPLYREPEVVPHLLKALELLVYPRDRLAIQFLVEPDDHATIDVLSRQALPGHMRITTAPPGMPRTKPRACNTGLTLADGDLLVIYDAEDRPEPDQLLKAAVAYRTLPTDVVCLQCRLDHYNSQQSLPTRWTSIDYLMWFRLVLPGLQVLGAPIPLGGTSNHFRLAALRELDGWDPFNVTEDCDLGLRIARRGWRTCMLASTTWEEGVADARGWITQRSRWLKGYLQTWMVQSRQNPWRAFGVRGFALASLCTIGLVGALVVNPIAWATMLLWLICGWSVVDTQSTLSLATLVVTIGLLFANLAAVGIAVGTCLRLGRRDLLGAAVISPIAWAMHSVASWKAVWEFVVRPFHWQKTQHGQAVADAGQRRVWQGVVSAALACVLAVMVMVYAGQRIGDDIARQAAAHGPPTQLPVFFLAREQGAIGLVAANNPNRPPPWRVVDAVTAPPCSTAEPAVALGATADFPSSPLALVSKGWRDLSAWAALACDVQVTADAPHDLRIAVHWRDEDGNWFQSVSEQRLIPGAWTRLEFPIHQPASWTALDHHRSWHPDLLRRVSELGVHVFSHQTYRGQVTVANLRSLPFAKATQDLYERAVFSLRRGAEATVPVMARWAMDFDLGRTWENPFDPEQVAVDIEITTPDGVIQRIPGFYFQEYIRQLTADREQLDAVGAPGWRVVYRARKSGVHHWRLLLSDHGGSPRELSTGVFMATATTHPGYIRRSEKKPELLAHDDGSFFYPLGQNLCHAVDLRPPVAYSFVTPPDQGTYTFDRYFAHMTAAGMNLARIWMTPWSYGLEGKSTWRHFHGLGRYNLANAWRLDHVLEDGEQHGITVLLTITHMSEMATDFGSHAWEDSALNAKNGGCLHDPAAFFTSPDVMKLYRQRMRYIVARWGDRPNITAWEFFGEANLVPGFEPDACAMWHQHLARYVHDLDQGRHLIFTHTHNWQLGNDLWSLPEIDCVQGNGYIRPPNHTPNHVINFDRYLSEVEHFHKPVLVAEYGGRSELGVPSEDYLCGQLHSGIWASFTSPFAGVALHWWWNFVEGADLYDHYRGLSRFAVGIDRLAKDYHPVRPIVSGPGVKLFASGMQDADSGFYWVYHPDLFEHWRNVPTVNDAILQLTGLTPGRYQVEFWDTLAGVINDTREVTLTGNDTIPLPKVPRDLALKIHHLE